VQSARIQSQLDSLFADKWPNKKYEDRRQPVIANVRTGTGPIVVFRRGDLGVSGDIMKVQIKDGNPRFVFRQGQKHITPKEDWPSSNKFWIYMFRAPYSALVTNLEAHSALAHWQVRGMGVQSMDFVAPDRQMYDFIQKQVSCEKLDLAHHDPADLFSADRGVNCLRAWFEVKEQEYNFDPGHSRDW